jgi:hypothetical protein
MATLTIEVSSSDGIAPVSRTTMSLITAGSRRSRTGFPAAPWSAEDVAFMAVNYTVQYTHVNS